MILSIEGCIEREGGMSRSALGVVHCFSCFE